MPALVQLAGTLWFLGVVDRIEGPVAVIERLDRSMVDVSLTDLPRDVSEGDWLLVRLRTLPPGKLARRGAVRLAGSTPGAGAPNGE